MKEVLTGLVVIGHHLSLATHCWCDGHVNEISMVTEMEAMNGLNNMGLHSSRLIVLLPLLNDQLIDNRYQ